MKDKQAPETSTRPAGPDRPTARDPQPNTLPAQGETQHPVPRRPFEMDESADSQRQDEPSMKDVGRVAQRDAERGVQDTTKGAELDATYTDLREHSRQPRKKFTP